MDKRDPVVNVTAKSLTVTNCQFWYCGLNQPEPHTEINVRNSVILVEAGSIVLESLIFLESKGVEGIVCVHGTNACTVSLYNVSFQKCNCKTAGAVFIDNQHCSCTVDTCEFVDFPVAGNVWGHAICARNQELTLTESNFLNCIAGSSGADRGNFVRFYPGSSDGVNRITATRCVFQMKDFGAGIAVSSNCIALCGQAKIGVFRLCEFLWHNSGNGTDGFLYAGGDLDIQFDFENVTFDFDVAAETGFPAITVDNGKLSVIYSSFTSSQNSLTNGVLVNTGEVNITASAFTLLNCGIVVGQLTSLATLEDCVFTECSQHAVEALEGSGNIHISRCNFDEGNSTTTTPFISVAGTVARDCIVSHCCFKTKEGRPAIAFSGGVVTLGEYNCFPHTSREAAITAQTVTGAWALFPCFDCNNVPVAPSSSPPATVSQSFWPTVTETPMATVTATPTPTASRTPHPSLTATPFPTVTATPRPTVTGTPFPTPTASPFPTLTATPFPTKSPVPTQSAIPLASTPPPQTPLPLPSTHILLPGQTPPATVIPATTFIAPATVIPMSTRPSTIPPPSSVPPQSSVPPPPTDVIASTEILESTALPIATKSLSGDETPQSTDLPLQTNAPQSTAAPEETASIAATAAPESTLIPDSTVIPQSMTVPKATVSLASTLLPQTVTSPIEHSSEATSHHIDQISSISSHSKSVSKSNDDTASTEVSVQLTSYVSSDYDSSGVSQYSTFETATSVSESLEKHTHQADGSGGEQEDKDDQGEPIVLVIVSALLMVVLLVLFIGVMYKERSTRAKLEAKREKQEAQQKAGKSTKVSMENV
jgi:hypothetical protein